MSADPRIDRAERQARVVDLHREGLTFEQIGEQLGVSRQRAYQVYADALAAIPAGAVEALRTEHLAQLAEAREAVMGVLRREHVVVSNGRVVGRKVGERVNGDTGETEPVWEDVPDDGPILDAARTLAVLQAREARLMGMDAPQRIHAETNGTVRYEITGADGVV